jgi:PAS domain S-box-containing protein
MRISLKARVGTFIVLVFASLGILSSLLFYTASRKSLEREVAARGLALSEALARAVDEGLAAENLNLIKQVEDIVHTADVSLVQVFSTLWLGVAAVPAEQLNEPPDPAVVAHFRMTGETDSFVVAAETWTDIYTPVLFDPHDARIRKLLIGYVRLRIADGGARRTIREAAVANILGATLLSLVAMGFLNAIISRSILQPVLAVHRALLRHRQGEFPEAVEVAGAPEIRELSAEFNRMSVALREREERLADEKERLAVTLRSIGDGVIVTDVEGQVTLVNRAAEQYTGWTTQEAGGRPLAEVFPVVNEKSRQPQGGLVETVVRTGQIVELAHHTVLVRRGGGEMAIEDSAAPIRDRNSSTIGVVIVFRDVTEKRRLEEELLNAEKLHSVGVLAGGLAHDFNNLLTGIVGNIALAKMYLGGGKAFDRLTEAEAASRRATDLTHQLLTFAKGGAPIRKASSVVGIVQESAKLILAGTSVAAEFAVPPEVPNVEVDVGQMSQVFNNLLINAVQAMPNGGTIRIAVDTCVLADGDVPTLGEGAYVRIALRDQGTGIPPEFLPRIFDPYFTTKQTGSGLGLASSYAVVKRHDGHITVESEPGRGATFTIYLPASGREAAPAGAGAEEIARGHGRVLVMDDEQIVREIAREMLAALGYEAVLVKNGLEAVEAYQRARAEGRPINAVIMDLTIPGAMGGKETVARLLAIDPAVRAIVSSGYSNDAIMADYAAHGFKGVITKPYGIKNFSQTLHDVLNA